MPAGTNVQELYASTGVTYSPWFTRPMMVRISSERIKETVRPTVSSLQLNRPASDTSSSVWQYKDWRPSKLMDLLMRPSVKYRGRSHGL